MRHRRTNDNDIPWLHNDCRSQMKIRDQLLKRAIKTGLTSDRQQFTSARNKVIQTMRKAKAHFYMTIKKLKRKKKKKSSKALTN